MNWFRPVFALTWFFVGVALLLRDSIGLSTLSNRYSAENLDLGGAMAIAFAGWNAVRWYSLRRQLARYRNSSRHNPLAAKVEPPSRAYEYNSELDFLKPGDTPEAPR